MKKFEYFQERFFKYLDGIRGTHPIIGYHVKYEYIKDAFNEAVEDTKIEASGKTTSDKRKDTEWAIKEEDRGNPVQDFNGYIQKKLKAIRDGEV